MPHSPARWPPYGWPETSRLLKVNHYMLQVRIKMRLGKYVTPLRKLIRGRGSQEFGTPVHDERYSLPDMDVCISWLKGRNTRLESSCRRGPTPRLQRPSRRL